MINWKKITEENFTEFLDECSLENIERNGVLCEEHYHSQEQTYVFLSKEGCVLNHAWFHFLGDDTLVCEAHRDECSEYDITHFALKSEFNKVLPEGATDVSTDI